MTNCTFLLVDSLEYQAANGALQDLLLNRKKVHVVLIILGRGAKLPVVVTPPTLPQTLSNCSPNLPTPNSLFS